MRDHRSQEFNCPVYSVLKSLVLPPALSPMGWKLGQDFNSSILRLGEKRCAKLLPMKSFNVNNARWPTPSYKSWFFC